MIKESVTAAENLGNGIIQTPGGDILSDSDITEDGLPMSNEHRIARMHPHLNHDEETKADHEDTGFAPTDGTAVAIGAAANTLLSEESREQANLTVSGFVASLSHYQRMVVQEIIGCYSHASDEIRESLKPRIHDKTRKMHRAIAQQASTKAKELLEKLTGTSSNPADNDEFLKYLAWKRLLMDNSHVIIEEIHRQEDTQDPGEKERDDDLGVTRW